MNNQEQLIIQKLQNGEESGLRQMFDLYYSPLCVFALKYIDSFDLAEDLVQDIFIGFWENNRVEQLNTSLKSYLFTSVKNNALNYIRKNKKYRIEELDDEFDMMMDDSFDPEDLEQMKLKLYQELENLSQQSRIVFEAIIFQNMKYKDVAEDLDISVNTVKTHFARALKQLRGSFDIILMIMLP
ncbi:RNA polymerase sigma-70 factor [Ancylomarina euxinus]|uniref:RNA polymerase sigma-70 factor n=1 Tax=Ancylomarina euxinus TaxID=2283627 RepID=A0A425XZ18_9BACT|nr:RNA polymerase sigma-70 factor [Ancylomarina euxinus]MCZ4695600.1 RNA polymerase sigma-70 factor [Ancylomarina euxinus]MUP15981.1 RNA polymerase sigma-70 factor [Ancylomarina euxinus]RRG20423.1 RNA polymerase sigma-70 factor [Ancylomarina euxinus]